tara:strand:- start:1109 stop:2221 length:1113 start_codon:yes stop_codon:yes gene_type:complete
MLKKIFLVGVVLLFLFESVFAIGIGPSKEIIDFEPNLEKKIEYYVINQDIAPVNVLVYKRGDLMNIIELENQTFEIGMDGTKVFDVLLKLPSSLPPGNNEVQIVASQLPGGDDDSGTVVTSLVNVVARLIIKVPYEDQYLKANIGVSDVKLGENVFVDLNLENLGLEDIDNYIGEIKIFDSSKKMLGSSDISGNLLSGESNSKQIEIEIDETFSGKHFAELSIDYSGKNVFDNTSFMIGNVFIEILDYPKEVYFGEISSYEIKIKSNWNEDINDAYAQLDIGEKSFKSEDFNIGKWEEKIVKFYVDMNNIEVGNYPAILSLHYEDTSTIEEFEISVVKKSSNLYIYGGILLILILVFFIYKKKFKIKYKK